MYGVWVSDTNPRTKKDQSATLHRHMLTGKNMSRLYPANLLQLCISSKMTCYWIKHAPVTFSFYLSCKTRTAVRWFICIINPNIFGQDTWTNRGDFWRLQNLFSIYLKHIPTVIRVEWDNTIQPTDWSCRVWHFFLGIKAETKKCIYNPRSK